MNNEFLYSPSSLPTTFHAPSKLVLMYMKLNKKWNSAPYLVPPSGAVLDQSPRARLLSIGSIKLCLCYP